METITLTNENIDMLSEKVADMYTRLGCTKKETMRARLLLEETLLKYQMHFGAETELHYKEYRVLSQTRFLIGVRTQPFDPFTLEENPMAVMLESVMSTFEGNMPTWKYRNLENEIVFSVRARAKISDIWRVATACVSAVLLAILTRAIFPAEALSKFVADYVAPLSNAYAGLFCVMAVLVTFFAIVLSIVHIGDMAVVGAIGGKMMRRFYLMTTILVVIAVIPLIPYYHVSGVGSVSFAAKSIYDIVVSFIPANIIRPFLDYNSLHVIIIGLMFGFSLLYLGQKGETLTRVFDECNLVSVYTNNFLNKFIFLFVAFKVYELIITSELSALSNAGRIAVMIIIGEIALFLFYTVYVCVKNKIPPLKYLRALMPTFAVCLSSANFGAALNCSSDALEELNAFDDKSNLAFNIGGVVFRPACTLVFVFSAFAMAQQYHVEITAAWVILAILLSVLLVAAAPNVPGVDVSVITLLYAQLGLPGAAVGLMIALNAPLQFLTVAVDTYCLLGECVCLHYWKEK